MNDFWSVVAKWDTSTQAFVFCVVILFGTICFAQLLKFFLVLFRGYPTKRSKDKIDDYDDKT